MASRLPLLLACALIGLTPLPRAHASSLLFDFGPTTVSGADMAVSPAQADGALSGTVTFNKITNDAAAANGSVTGLLFANGTSATGVTLALGFEDAGSTDINTIVYGVGVTFSSLAGGAVTDGVYAGTSVARDGIFSPAATAGFQSAVGLRIDGLAVGDYVLYLSSRNTNSTGARSETFTITTGATTNSFNFGASGLSSASIANNGATSNPSFAAGINYNKLAFTIQNAGDSLYLATVGTTSAERRGFLNSLEVVGVPEPGAALLLGAGFVLLLSRRRGAA